MPAPVPPYTLVPGHQSPAVVRAQDHKGEVFDLYMILRGLRDVVLTTDALVTVPVDCQAVYWPTHNWAVEIVAYYEPAAQRQRRA
jgi:hypothetical protein